MLQYVLVSVCNLWSINEGKILCLSIVRRNGNFLCFLCIFRILCCFSISTLLHLSSFVTYLSEKKYPTGLILYLCCYCFVILSSFFSFNKTEGMQRGLMIFLLENFRHSTVYFGTLKAPSSKINIYAVFFLVLIIVEFFLPVNRVSVSILLSLFHYLFLSFPIKLKVMQRWHWEIYDRLFSRNKLTAYFQVAIRCSVKWCYPIPLGNLWSSYYYPCR